MVPSSDTSDSASVSRKERDDPPINGESVSADDSSSTVDLKKKTVSGAAITMTQSGVSVLLQMVAIPILARLLTPGDYGIMAMATTVTGLAALFSEAGLGVATVQKREISREYVDSMFWFSAAVGLALTIVTALLSPLVVWFFGEPALLAVTIVLGSAFTINGLAVQHRAMLARNLRFLELAIIDISAAVFSFALAIGLAYFGFGYWALVVMVPSAGLLKTISLWAISDWAPGRPAMAGGVFDSLRFGANVTGFSFLNYFVRRGDDIIIGRFFGPELLGFYNRAYSLLTLPLRQITAPLTMVMVPALSRLQNDPDRFNRFYGQANSVAIYLVNPFIIILILFPEDCVLLILGRQWMEAAPLAGMLAIGGVIQPLVSSLGWVFLATGKPELQLRWALLISPIFIMSFLIGAQFGVYGVAVGFMVSAILNGVGSILYASRFTILDLPCLIRHTAMPYALGIAIFFLLLGLRGLVTEAGLIRVGVTLAVVIFSYVAFFLLNRKERQRMKPILLMFTKK